MQRAQVHHEAAKPRSFKDFTGIEEHCTYTGALLKTHHQYTYKKEEETNIKEGMKEH